MTTDLATSNPDTDVLIVGAGPTGLTLASELLSRSESKRVADLTGRCPGLA